MESTDMEAERKLKRERQPDGTPNGETADGRAKKRRRTGHKSKAKTNQSASTNVQVQQTEGTELAPAGAEHEANDSAPAPPQSKQNPRRKHRKSKAKHDAVTVDKVEPAIVEAGDAVMVNGQKGELEQEGRPMDAGELNDEGEPATESGLESHQLHRQRKRKGRSKGKGKAQQGDDVVNEDDPHNIDGEEESPPVVDDEDGVMVHEKEESGLVTHRDVHLFKRKRKPHSSKAKGSAATVPREDPATITEEDAAMIDGYESSPAPDNVVPSSTLLESNQALVKPKKVGGTGRRDDKKKDTPSEEVAKGSKKNVTAAQGWSVSGAVGGRFIDAAPRLSRDEKYLICATESALLCYNASDSSLHKALHKQGKDFLTAFELSKDEPNAVWAASSSGLLTKWDFTIGKSLLKRPLNEHVQGLRVVAGPEGKDLIFTSVKKGRQFTLTSHALSNDGDLGSTMILQLSKKHILDFQVRESGKLVVATMPNGLLIGTVDSTSKGAEYTWRKMNCSEPPTCFDVNITAKTGRKSGVAVDVVVGGLRGSIFIFRDVLRGFEAGSHAELAPRQQQLHWHREAVGAVAWSLEGQYIVSGGRETVLVLWQLETGRKQFLPNLESPIRDIVLSPGDASYVVRLADNSVMVLSTAELSPTMHVAGVQASSFTRAATLTATLPTVDLINQFRLDAPSNRVAAALRPRDSAHLLVSVPAHQSAFTFSGPLHPAPYLQDYDVSTARFVSRQAITRTNATNINLGPEGNSISEPDVKYVQISNDGRWMATVDEWQAPSLGVREPEQDQIQSTNTLESKLRFWLWNEQDKQWMLNSRIDDPHRLEHEQTSLPVLAMSVDPTGTRFSTLGADSIVRTWCLKSKLHNGNIIRGEATPKGKNKDSWWALDFSVSMEQSVAFDSFQSVVPDRGCLAYSNDGSMLAAYQHYDTFEDNAETVSFIDTATGSLHETRTGLLEAEDGIHALDFLGQYLILLGRDNVAVWDVTSFSLRCIIPIPTYPSPGNAFQKKSSFAGTVEQPNPIPHLAVNVPTNTFAVAIPEQSKRNGSLYIHPLMRWRTGLSIYSPASGAEPIFYTALPRTTTALLSAGGTASIAWNEESEDITGHMKGYTILDLGAEVRTIKFKGLAAKSLPTPPPSEPEATPDGGADVDENSDAVIQFNEEFAGDAMEVDEIHNDRSEDDLPTLPRSTADTRPVVRREQLAEVFDYPPMAMPSMQELFDGVLKLYVGKPAERSTPPPQRPGPAGGEAPGAGADMIVADAEVDAETDSDSDSL